MIYYLVTNNQTYKMSSQNSSQKSSKSVSEKQMLLEEMSDLESQMAELMKKLNLLEQQPKKTTLFVFENKEEIAAKKTQKQLDVENNSPLFKRKNISDDKIYHPYRTGIQRNEKRYIDMFNYIILPREGRREGKVKYINECLNLDNFKKESLKESKNESSLSVKIPEKKKEEKSEKGNKIIIALNKKKINDLRITARDMKIKNYSVMKKEELVKSIYDILKQKETEKEKKEKEQKEKEETIKDINTKKSKSELLKQCGVDESVNYDENDLNGNNDENLFYDEDDCDEDSIDYE